VISHSTKIRGSIKPRFIRRRINNVCLISLVFIAMLGLSGCITETTGAIQQAPDPVKQVKAYVDLGVGYVQNGEFARAKDNLNKALEIDSDSADAHHVFGRLFQLEGEYALAEDHYKKALASEPELTRARMTYGAFLYTEGRYEEAERELSIAADDRLYQMRAQVFEYLGMTYTKLNQPREAELAYLRATQLNPNQARALLELSEIRFDQRNYVEARNYYRKSLKVAAPSSRSLWLCIRLARIFRDDDQEASCSLTLRNVFPASEEYKLYQSVASKNARRS